MIADPIRIAEEDLQKHFQSQYGDVRNYGWRVRMRYRFGYFDPDAWYEALVDRLVTAECSWIDVGGGSSIFPYNAPLAARLARRGAFLVGVDPSNNIEKNPWVHEKAQCGIEEYRSDRRFDLATLRMVAEHITEPERAVKSLARLVKPGGRVVIYTPNRWAPVSLAASIIPFRWHHHITGVLWQTQEADVFPTVYQMNTRRRLRHLFEQAGFREAGFLYLDNCSTFQRFRFSCFLELSLWWILRRVGIGYPENNLLGVYERV